MPLLAIVWLAAAGDTASFLLGRGFGRPFLEVHGARLRLDAGRLARVERFYERHGGKAVIAGRFVGFARAVTPFLAGASRFPLRRFVGYSVVGALAWAALFTLAGYAFSDSVVGAGDAATRVALGAVLVIALLSVSGSRIRSGRWRRSRRGLEPQRAQAEDDAQRGACDAVEQRANGRRAWSPALEQKRMGGVHGRDGARALLVVVNGRASGASSANPLVNEVTTGLAAHGLRADAVVTHDEDELGSVLAAADGRRVVLVGGDGSLQAAANAPLPELPELALVPAGRANNIARALGIPTDPARAVALAARAAAWPLDALRVETPERSLYALEALSVGFQAEARARYAADNSGDLRQGVYALAHAARRYTPYRVELRLDDRQIEVAGAAQLFISNLPFFGFGFEVDPGADPADGCFEAILIEARNRRALLVQLAAAYRGRHIGRRGVQRIAARRAELTVALPLVADSVPLGTTTATVRLERARVRLATPDAGVAR